MTDMVLTWVDGQKVIRPRTSADDPTRPDVPTQRLSATLPRKTFATRAAEAGWITYPEATAYANGASVPASVEAVLSSQPAQDQARIRHEVLTEDVVKRGGALMPGLVLAFSATDADMDAIFGIS